MRLTNHLHSAIVQENGVSMEEDWLSKCVIDPSKRKIYLYSEGGEKKTVECDTVQEFMNVLRFVRSTTSEDMISYAEPL